METIKRKLGKLFSITYWLDRLFIFVMATKGSREQQFYTYHKRPLFPANKVSDVITYYNQPKIAIVMQGPLCLDKNFTLETIKLYSKHFPDIRLLLSTWENEDATTILKIKELGCIVIENKKPSFSGHHNINYQIVSSYSGIERAKELGVEYVLKTRTDQRIYSPNALQLFIELDKQYPPDSDSDQTRRLLIPNFGTLKYRPYSMGDMIMYGHINDMLTFWEVNKDERIIKVKESYSVLELSKLMVTEVYLTSEYLKKLGHTLLWSLEDSWNTYGKYFCIFDHASIDMFWYKDFGFYSEFRFLHYGAAHSRDLMDYATWLTCYSKTFDPTSLPKEILAATDGDSL